VGPPYPAAFCQLLHELDLFSLAEQLLQHIRVVTTRRKVQQRELFHGGIAQQVRVR
jgi:hypothetical protein